MRLNGCSRKLAAYQQIEQDHGLAATMDQQLLLDLCEPALTRVRDGRQGQPSPSAMSTGLSARCWAAR